ncbi:hypothetical protein RUM44_007087 [Polyplax serrata]|uniref:Uncharacterized protein n=1 Tax=Polyplax serrata TaxID=468196 RepID=A0ABR1B0H3_POLSC
MGTVVCLPENVTKICGESAHWLIVRGNSRKYPNRKKGPEAGHVQPVTVKAAPLQSEVKVRESEEYEYKIIRLSSASDEDDRMGPEEERTQRQVHNYTASSCLAVRPMFSHPLYPGLDELSPNFIIVIKWDTSPPPSPLQVQLLLLRQPLEVSNGQLAVSPKTLALWRILAVALVLILEHYNDY